MTTIGITGGTGLLGWHTRCYLRATSDFHVLAPERALFGSDDRLDRFVSSCDVVVHTAGVNRGSDEDILEINRRLADSLIRACRRVGSRPHIVFANSTHHTRDTAYGKAKRGVAATFGHWAEREGGRFTDVVFPHVFGEHGRPFANSVVSTFCHQLANGVAPVPRDDGELELLHAQRAARAMIDASGRDAGSVTQIRVKGRPSTVRTLLARLEMMHRTYTNGIVPSLAEQEDIELFNTLRSSLYPYHYPIRYDRKTDSRGALVELFKCESGGQTVVSESYPGVIRGNHFHTAKVERFAVVSGDVSVRIRRLFDAEVVEFRLSGRAPAYIDIPTLHTHNLTNVGATALVMAFWSNEMFDPVRPDTVSEPV